MKLSYSVPGKIWWISNFLDYNMYKGIHDAIIKERKQINLHTSKGVWSEHLINNIEYVCIFFHVPSNIQDIFFL